MIKAVDATTTLRVAVAADAVAIRALTRDAYAAWVPLIGREPLPMTVDYDEAVSRHRFDLLFRDDNLVALIETVAETDHLLIENVAVLPSAQGRGIGRVLLTHAETLAAEQGFAEVRLYTNQRFERNIAIYRQAGYRIDREEELPHGVAVHMSKRVEPAR